MLSDRYLSCLFVTLVNCDQTVRWTNVPLLTEASLGPCLIWPNGWMAQVPLGTKVGLGPGDIVSGDDTAPNNGAQQPPLSAHVCCGQTAG